MVFKAEGILTMPGVCFSDGNMQSPRTTPFSDDAAFGRLLFDQIYHVGPIDQGSDTIRWRCAEALVPDALSLDGHLQAVLCRSPAERATLLHMLGDGEKWSSIIRVYTEPGVFENRYAYVDSVAVSRVGVSFTTHPRYDVQPIRLDIKIDSLNGETLGRFVAEAAPANRTIRCNIELESGSYLVEIKVDGCLAYRAVSLIDELPF
jgi:hypothetical protein